MLWGHVEGQIESTRNLSQGRAKSSPIVVLDPPRTDPKPQLAAPVRERPPAQVIISPDVGQHRKRRHERATEPRSDLGHESL